MMLLSMRWQCQAVAKIWADIEPSRMLALRQMRDIIG